MMSTSDWFRYPNLSNPYDCGSVMPTLGTEKDFFVLRIGLLCTEWWNWVHDISDYISLTNRTCWIFLISLFSLSCFIDKCLKLEEVSSYSSIIYIIYKYIIRVLYHSTRSSFNILKILTLLSAYWVIIIIGVSIIHWTQSLTKSDMDYRIFDTCALCMCHFLKLFFAYIFARGGTLVYTSLIIV